MRRELTRQWRRMASAKAHERKRLLKLQILAMVYLIRATCGRWQNMRAEEVERRAVVS